MLECVDTYSTLILRLGYNFIWDNMLRVVQTWSQEEVERLSLTQWEYIVYLQPDGDAAALPERVRE